MIEKQYLDLLRYVLANGVRKEDRTGTGTLSVFGQTLRHDLSKGFPLLTTKSVHFKSVAFELLWFLRGETNTKFLTDNGVTIWNEWADQYGNLGRVYGAQWRSWRSNSNMFGTFKEIDQIAEVIAQIKKNPHSRRHIVSAWNVGELSKMALLPCHILFQFYVAEGKLSCMVQMRSCDLFLGLPFNIASYALLTHLVASVTNLQVGELIMNLGDTHIYLNHLEQVNLQLSRNTKPLPTLQIDQKANIFDYNYSDFTLVGYNPHPAIKAPVAV